MHGSLHTHFTRMRTDTDALDFGWMRNAPFKKTCKKKIILNYYTQL